MTSCEIILSANAGVSLVLGDTCIWADTLHNHKTDGFSSVSKEMWQEIKNTARLPSPDIIIYTHCHPDHFSVELTAEAHSLWSHAKVVLPEAIFDYQYLLEGQRCSLKHRELSLDFSYLVHEGSTYAHVANYGCILEQNGFRVLISGDCSIGNPALTEFVGQKHIDLAILPFPWITLQKGREYLTKLLKPDHIFVCHLPFAPDDTYGYINAANYAKKQLPDTMDIRLLQTPFQKETIE